MPWGFYDFTIRKPDKMSSNKSSNLATTNHQSNHIVRSLNSGYQSTIPVSAYSRLIYKKSCYHIKKYINSIVNTKMECKNASYLDEL